MYLEPEATFKAFGIKTTKKMIKWINNIKDDDERNDRVFSLINNCMKDVNSIKQYDKLDIGLDSDVYSTYKEIQEEQDRFLACPFTVTKNDDVLIDCRMCNSKNTFSMSIQDRSGDEAMSIIIMCGDCGNRERRTG